MKKRVLTAVIAAMGAVFSVSTAASAQIGVLLNGEHIQFDVPPAIINDRTMVPVRAIFESLGALVEWDQANQLILAEKNDTSVIMGIDLSYMIVNGAKVNLDTPPVIVNERTLVPVRAVSEAFNMNVSWDQKTQTVIIGNKNQTTEEYTEPEQNDDEDYGDYYTPNEQDWGIPDYEEEYTEPAQSDVSYADSGNDTNFGVQVLNIVNQHRSAAGLNPLVWDDSLAECAFRHSSDMAARGFFDHTNLDGLSPFDRMRNMGIGYMSAAENIAAGQQTPEDVMETWMNSPGHHANIMNGLYNKLGVGVAYGGSYGIYWTQCFTD